MSKIYTIIYTEEFGILNNLEQTLKSYNIPNQLNKDSSISQIEYQGYIYSVRLYITRFQREVLFKKGIHQTRESNIKHQFIEIELLSELSDGNISQLGLPSIINDAIIKSIRKPIYHISTLNEIEMDLLRENQINQFIDRYEMAKYLDTDPIRIDEESFQHQNFVIECFIMDKCRMDKSITANSKLAWFSIGEKVGEDPWGMTNLQFIPIDFQQYKYDIETMYDNEKIKRFFVDEISVNANILRLGYNRNGESCSYFIDNHDEFVYNSIKRIY